MITVPAGWHKTDLGSAGRWLSGGTPKTDEPSYWGGDIPWIGSGSLTNFRLSDSERRVTELGSENGTRIVATDTILMVVRGMSLKSEFRIGMATKPMAFGQDCKALVARKGIDPHFLAYAIRSRTPEILAMVDEAGHGTGRLNSDQLFAVEVNIPPLPEQRAIAEVLGALDDKIAANMRVKKAALQLAAATYQGALMSGPTRKVELRSVAQNVPGKYLSKDKYVSHGEYLVFGSNSVMGRHDTSLVPGAIAVLAKIGSHCGNLRWSERPSWINNNASAIVPNAFISPWILRHALDLLDMGPHRAGTGQPYIRMESLFSAVIELPSSVMSDSIASLLKNLSMVEVIAEDENRTLAETRDALLPQLMSGKLRVRDAETVVEAVV